ncbi:MAG TPA: sulfide/dihydroorotate dehydrogenase-like FAD/NAD-binding protein, partial [Candidatus Angelobacter sp.]|nr:sulfide/dihydroorotate dehydrogenase-like FAD/NAD-binding protein [Candidatus Angelobacter sp.]
MFPIVATRQVARGIKLFEIKAPRIAKKQRPGQFVIIRLEDTGERVPLTLADANPEAGTITIVVQGIGKTTMLLNMLDVGDSILDIVGPLGKASEIENFGTAVIVSGSVGTAMAYPTARELKRAGNKVISIVGARSKDLLVLEDEVRAVSDETYVLTDDGSAGEKGLVTHKLQELVDAGKVNYVLAVGPVPMMRACAKVTEPQKIRTMVSLNSIMVDGTGMCGGCRVLVNNSSQFACVDGPEFDATQVNFEVLMQRNAMYRDKECQSLKYFEEHREEELCQLRADLAH